MAMKESGHVVMVVSCGHTTQQTWRSYARAVGASVPPMEWCHTCGHARFVKGWR